MPLRIERSSCLVLFTVAACNLVAFAARTAAQDNGKTSDKPSAPESATPSDKKDEAPKPAPVGLVTNDPKAFQGYNLMSPLNSNRTYLFDMQGRVVRTWQSDCSPALCPYLLSNGHILRGGSIGIEAQVFGPGPGVGGRVQEFTWDGDVVWDFRFFNSKQLPHHDLTPLPNGNVLMIVWDRKTADEALAAGRRPELTGDSHLLVDSLVEIKPTGKTTGEVVWEWHLWNHLVQDFDNTKPNYGNVADHPELVNLNFGEDALAPIAATKDGANTLKSVGYIGANSPGRPRANPDWTHFNGVAYNADLDQVIVSVHAFSEFWIIDHSTSAAEAAGHQGGRSGKGGDLLYRYGNPRAYRAGKKEDQKLFAQHNAHWIGKGLPGEGHVLVFNNGGNRPDGSYSSVDELVLPVDSQGRYEYKPGTAYGPDKPVWSYTAPKKTDFYSFFISGAQRLPSGDTLICSGANGTAFEVTPDKEVVWKYVNPVKGQMGSPGGFGPLPRPGQVLTPIVRTLLGITPEQATQLDDAQKEVDAQLSKLLTVEQKTQLAEPESAGQPSAPTPPGPNSFFGPSFQVGTILTAPNQSRLKLSDEQKTELAAIQKEVDAKLDKILSQSQRKQTKGGFAFGGPPPGGGQGGPGQGGPGGPSGPPQPGQILPPIVRDALKLNDDQKKHLDALQTKADETLAKLLTEEQQKQIKEARGPASMPPPGQLISPTLQARLKLTAEQKKELQSLQSQADATLAEVFTDEQKKQFKELQANPPRGGLASGPPAGQGGPPPGGGGPGGGPPGGPGGPGGPPGGPGGGFPSNPVFRVYRFAATHPGLSGQDLTPHQTIEEMQPKEPQAQAARGDTADAKAAVGGAK
jgi:Spy/CpxP family protein refolding chaperone